MNILKDELHNSVQSNQAEDVVSSEDAAQSEVLGNPNRYAASGPTRLCLLSNGSYSVMLSVAGSGWSRWRDMSVNRWREEPTRDSWGSYLLLRDEDNGVSWSPTRQPLGAQSEDVVVNFSAGLAKFASCNHVVDSTLEVAVAADADIELRRLTLCNRGEQQRRLSITSYMELVLGLAGADSAHPAFSKMFVHTEWEAQHGMLLATRRRRTDDEATMWAAHALQIEGQTADRACEYETDRARFLGRCRTLGNAQAMQRESTLSNTTGFVLDPVFSLRQHITLAPGASVRLLLWTRLADSRDGALALATEMNNPRAAGQLFAGASSFATTEQVRLGIHEEQSERFGHWMSAVLASDSHQRATADALMRGRGGPPVLWSAGISDDRPIVVLRLAVPTALERVHDLLLAQIAWRSKRLAVDVVLLNTAAGADGDVLRTALEPLVSAQRRLLTADSAAPKAELFVLHDQVISEDLRNGLLTAARVLLGGHDSIPTKNFIAPSTTTALRACTPADPPEASPEPTEFTNGSGGFSQAGRAYTIHLEYPRCTSAPWINVIANPEFGFLVSAEGGGYVWSLNSQQNPITPWPNDPVSDIPHEALYLRDEDTGAVWSATALPIGVVGAHYEVTHGKGFSCFTNDAHGIGLALTQCVPTTDSIKLSRLRLCNRSSVTRHLSITAYVEWALGANGTTPAPFVITSRDDRTGALFARNAWRSDFGERVAFFDMAGLQQSMSGDRGEFLGRFGAVGQPAALQSNSALSGCVGAGLDPCGALQTRIELPPNTQFDLMVLLGDAAAETDAQSLIMKYRTTGIEQVLAGVATQWNGLLDTVQVDTPDRAMDIMLNDWLLYQVLSCRVWARTAYYQASGAYGFRDQLQDVMALCVSRPDLARDHLLRAAGRQFAEGDVQHWWLPPGGQGIRTKIADDRIWLAYVAMHYVEVTGDAAVLDEVLPFLTGQTLTGNAIDAFFQPGESIDNVSVYEHCARAIDSSLTHGAHGLPLIQTGDWNDGMNSVGEEGRGESSWLAWLLLATIAAFAPCAVQRGESARARHWNDYATDMRASLERAWDGLWYRRGYYDNGVPLGSSKSDECQIDSIAQSWSVLAGAANPKHAAQAMVSVDRLLVDHHQQIASLFTPPFDRSTQNPGYIKGYPPGVRENGGQYTHGATWSIFAWAQLGEGDRAGAMFNLLNPIHHSDSAESVARYKVEPYVACADVYSVAPHVGRGGWTWYTGSAAWLYRAGLEAVLGFQLHGDRLRIDPCIPKAWPGYKLIYQRRGKQHANTTYVIKVENPDHVCRGVARIELDGIALAAADELTLTDDGQTHVLQVVLG